MAKNHILPRYLLWVAVCICVLLGGGILGGYLPFAVRHLPEVDNRAAVYGKQRIDRGSVRLYRKVDQHLNANSMSQNAISKQLEEIYRAEIGVKEATGNNDGNRVEEYLRYCGLGEGYAWCAAFVSWCHGQAGYPEPRNAWAAALFPAKRAIWRNSVRATAATAGAGVNPVPTTGDVFGIYYSNLKRIAHVGFVDQWDDRYCITVEGNTGPPTDNAITDDHPANPIRAGPSTDGVYRKRRLIKTIKAVARWTK